MSKIDEFQKIKKMEFPHGSVYLDDCMNIISHLDRMPLTLTDIPYGTNIGKMNFTQSTRGGVAKRTDYSKCDVSWDNQIPDKNLFDALFNLTDNQIIFGGIYVPFLPITRGWVIWDKKVEDKYQNDFGDCEMAWTSYDKPTKIYRWLWHGMIQQDMKNKDKRIHPTQKPVGLFVNLIMDYSQVGDVIFDPFAGSMTTAIACLKTNRRFVCIEKKPKILRRWGGSN